jgi:hypothetical protein
MATLTEHLLLPKYYTDTSHSNVSFSPCEKPEQSES